MAKISKKDANPILALLLALVFGLGHLIINGQQRKFIFCLVIPLVGSCLGILGFCPFLPCIPCILAAPGLVIWILSAIEAYKTAEHLQKGEEIEENDYFFAPMYKIVKLVDKTATFKS